MKLINIKNSIFFLLLFVFIAGCKEDEIVPEEVVSNSSNEEINSWVYEEMTDWYLWTDKLAAKETTNNTLTPDEYFASLLYQPGDTDRFSWIQESAEELRNSLNGRNTSLGIRTTPFYTNDERQNVAFSIAYVLKGSPAERAGLKRGDFITKVGGNDITLDTYGSALSPENLSLTLGDYVGGDIVPNSTVINVTKEEVQTNPLQHHSIIEEGDKKIGYLVYTQYLSQYDDEMREVFGEFKTAGVNELVLDLRYNGGGYISSATTLSSLIGKGVSSNSVCYRDEWNANITSQFNEDSFTKYFRDEANNIGGSLNRVFVLTSRSTASASELTMNNLLPYMEVIQIGDNTYGKNVGSITIDDDQNRWKWGMQPIVLRTVNANGKSDYGTKEGFTPDVRVSDNRLPFLAFGDKEETLLGTAIEYIKGGPALATSANARIRTLERVSPLTVTDNPRENRFEMYAEPLTQR